MAHGRPDFFGTPVHPKYGTTKVVFDTALALPKLIQTTVFNILGKGVIAGGFVALYGGLIATGDIVLVTIDNAEVWYTTAGSSLNNNLSLNARNVLQLSCFDIDGERESWVIGFEFPFDLNVKLQITPNDDDLQCDYRITYFDIE